MNTGSANWGTRREAIRLKLCTTHVLFDPYGIQKWMWIPLSRTYVPHFAIVPTVLYCITPGLILLICITWTSLYNPSCSISVFSGTIPFTWKCFDSWEADIWFGVDIRLKVEREHNTQRQRQGAAGGAEKYALQTKGKSVLVERRQERVFSLRETALKDIRLTNSAPTKLMNRHNKDDS